MIISESTKHQIVDHLKAELVRRSHNNSRYSIRTFAQSLGIDHSLLTKILNHKRLPSRQMTAQLIGKLNLAIVENQEPSKQTLTQANLNADESDPYELISKEQFRLIFDIYHYAILEVIKLSDFEACENWIAKRLGISVHVVRSCIERLKATKLLEESIAPSGHRNWIDRSSEHTTHVVSPNYGSIQHIQHQLQILELSIKAMKKLPLTHRDQSSMMITTSHARLEQAKKMIKTFRRELAQFLEQEECPDTIYQLSISFFPLTEIQPKNRSKK